VVIPLGIKWLIGGEAEEKEVVDTEESEEKSSCCGEVEIRLE